MRLIDSDNIEYIDPESDLYGRYALEEDINMIPTVDAVPVVRCKDCKFGRDKPYGIWCSGKMMPSEWYCADGERKKDPGGGIEKETES